MKTKLATRRRFSASSPDGLIVAAMLLGATIVLVAHGRLAGLAAALGL